MARLYGLWPGRERAPPFLAAGRRLSEWRNCFFCEDPDLSPLDTLFEAASEARARAYAPYSGFKVGAAVLGQGGAVYAGCNVENAAYPVGTCAEAAAIAAMVAAGETRIAAVLVVGEGDALVTPCGACRQRIREFAAGDAAVHVAGPGGVRRSFTLDELLPFSFGPDNLPSGRP